ncbi:MAG: TfoX/Sxy family protein [Chloroflexi bacterium]|nr:TfoX/Sxy family protein [Chloroflexota bacterium]
MAYDERVAERVRETLSGHAGISEQRSFGGISFLLNGNMSCGVLNDELVVRVGPDAYDEAVGQPHARPMDFTGRPMRGWVYVATDGFSEDADLETWVALGIEFASSLPAK